MMQHSFQIVNEVLEFAAQVVGKRGPVYVDTSVAAHDVAGDTVDGDDRKGDTIVINGTGAGGVITTRDVAQAFQRYKPYLEGEEGGRSYFWEGLSKQAPDRHGRHWCIGWGS
jgi:hypothetical protein